MAFGLMEASWLRDIVKEILGRSNLTLVNDSQACLANIYSSPYKLGNRNLGTKFHWISEEVRNGSASMRYKLTYSIPADGLTKALNQIKHMCFCIRIGLKDLRRF